MWKNNVWDIDKTHKFRKQFPNIQSNNLDGLLLKKTIVNIYRTKMISNILIFINMVLIYIDISKFSPLWDTVHNYKRLFYAHLFIIFFLLIYRYILYTIEDSANKKIHKFIKVYTFMYLICIETVLLWCVFLAINAQGIHGQISAYIMGVLCLVSSLVLNAKESIIIYTSALLIFILGLLSIPIAPQVINGHIINASFLTFLAFGISNINYNAYANNFIHEQIIKEKNNELNNAQKQLKQAVELRTEQLTKANEKLIKEIKLRHDAEIETMMGRLLYEEKVKLLDEAREYEELRSAFFANISHELRTPLNVILSAQHMVGKVMKDDLYQEQKGEKILHYNRIIQKNSYRLIRLLTNLIDITKIDARSFDLRLQNYDIVEIVESITLSVVPFVESKNVNIIFDTETEEKIIACDPDQIERIILNLISNAVKFTPQGGYIYVNIYDNVDEITISIKDTGIGIPPLMQEKIFERFVQVDYSTKRKQEGSGIGLSLVKSLIEMHKGSITLQSSEEKGSEFVIKIPNTTIAESKTDNTTIESNTNSDKPQIEKINIEFSDIYT